MWTCGTEDLSFESQVVGLKSFDVGTSTPPWPHALHSALLVLYP